MSRTRKTAPWPVRVFYKKNWLEEYHDHRFGPCDLPELPESAKDFDEKYVLWYGGKRRDDQTRCYWTASYSQFWTHPLARCSCYMCGYDAYEVPRRLRERREGKRYCQDGWKDEY